MKIYVVPVENLCNARCYFCITRFKNEKGFGELLNVADLSKIFLMEGIDKIEITGGGEPFLHPKITEIINNCVRKAPTQIYTNASLLSLLSDEVLKNLLYLCISRLHYDDGFNEKLMGVRQDIDFLRLKKIQTRIKLSLVLCRLGINAADDLKKYLNWAEIQGVKKVVVRQLFNFEAGETIDFYSKLVAKEKEYVPTKNLMNKLAVKYYDLDNQGNPLFKWGDLEVEIEHRNCACEIKYPVLRGDGNVYFGWSDKLWFIS